MSVLLSLYRVRGIILFAAVIITLASTIIGPMLPDGALRAVVGVFPLLGLALFALALMLLLLGGLAVTVARTRAIRR